MKLTDFKALTFDCYGTLIDWETGITAALKPWASRHGVSAGTAELLARFARFESEREAQRPAKPYPAVLAAVLRDIAGEFGIAATQEDAEAFARSVRDWPAFPDSREALHYLKRHYKLVIVSNVDRASFRHSNDKLGVAFDLVVTAEDAGSYKPGRAHFDRALAGLAAMTVPKDKVLHTAQILYHDHVPAKKLGLATIWINRQAGKAKAGPGATPPPPEAVSPDFVVPSMAAMVELHRAHLAA
ncbi:MAG: haloacid dehalogenase type II [Kiloniellaceae bacterium]